MPRFDRSRTEQPQSHTSCQDSRARSRGPASEPPAYGIDWVDRGIDVGDRQPLPPVQAKPDVVSPPYDASEREADRVARDVVGRLDHPRASGEPDAGAGAALSRRPPRVMAKSVRPMSGPTPPDFRPRLHQARGGGQPLGQPFRGAVEQAMGADFSGVRVHTDPTAHRLSQSIQAKAFATGRDIFFSRGTYAPDTRAGRHVIAHELAHVVQQNGSVVRDSSSASYASAVQRLPNEPEVTQDEESAVNSYLHSGYLKMNAPLRQGRQLSGKYATMVERVDSALAKLLTAYGAYSGTVYRSDNIGLYPAALLKQYKKQGAIVSRPAYTSTAKIGTGVAKPAPDQFVISNPRTGVDVTQLRGDEDEVLFPRNARFRITKPYGSKEKNMFGFKTKNANICRMEEVE